MPAPASLPDVPALFQGGLAAREYLQWLKAWIEYLDSAGGSVYALSAYGAVGDGVTDDGPSIRLALAAAEAAGGGIVEGEPGKNYLVIPLDVTGALWTAWRAIAMPANVTLDLRGSTLTAQHQSGIQDGCIIGPAGTESVASDYGAASGWTLRNATLASSSGSSVTTGNFISIHRCQNVTIENVKTGSAAAYHFMEIQRVKNVKIRNFTILHESGSGAAHPEIQLDGNGNPASPTSSFSHTTVMEDVLFENVQMRTLGADATKVRRIEIGHSAGTYRRVTFRGCYLAGLTNSGIGDYAILDCNAIAGVVVEDMLIEGCTFQHNAMSSGGGTSCIKFPDTANVTLRGLVVRNNRFTGNYRSGVQVGTLTVVTATSGNYVLKRGIHIHDNYFAPEQVSAVAGQTGTTSIICVQGCEDVVVENNFELSPATETNLTSNTYYSIQALNNKRAHIRNNTICRTQAAIGDMANGANYGIYVRIDEVLALSGTQEVVLEVTGNSVAGVVYVAYNESASPSGWTAGAYTRIKGMRARNLVHTMGTFGSNVINLPIGLWAAPPGTLLTGAASTDDTVAGLYAADGGNIASTITTVNTLAGHIATALYTTSMPTSAGQRAVLTPSQAI